MDDNISFKTGEIYSNLKVPAGWFYVRLDGWNFRSLSKRLGLEKPFDQFLTDCMVETAKVLFSKFNSTLAYLFSDEINLLLSKFTVFNLRLEKIDSIFSGLASSTLYKLLSQRYEDLPEVSFDCRIILTGDGDVVKYLVLRQREAYRNCYNAYAQHVLIRKGLKTKEAAEKLKNVKLKDLKRLIEENGSVSSKIPEWHKRGILLRWEQFEKEGYDPIKDERVIAKRRRIKVEWDPPWFSSSKGEEMVKRWICPILFH